MNSPRFSWDEPPRCSTPRGWLILTNHPDRKRYGDDAHRCVGNYLQYLPEHFSKGPEGERVHSSAYFMQWGPAGVSTLHLGHAWHHTTAEARAWIETTLAAWLATNPEVTQ